MPGRGRVIIIDISRSAQLPYSNSTKQTLVPIMVNSRLTVAAFLAYVQAALKQDSRVSQEINSMRDALSDEVVEFMTGMR